MDPEQVYQEVLQEEQQKGVSPPVAEGRAKAARARAEAGSPHPKEPKWWPGSQPHLEGAEAPAEAPAAEAAPAAEEVPEVAEVPAAEAPAAEAAPAEAPAEPAPAPPAEAPAPAAAAAPTEQPAAQAPAATGTAVAEPARPPGVIHGVETGTRLRPEDAVATEAQFEGQRSMYERRKLIDELIATGVPAVAAEDTGRERSALSLLLYVVIPLLAIVFVVVQAGVGEETASPPAGPAPVEADVIVAEAVQFDTDELRFGAGEPSPLTLRNDDTVPHNVAIYETEQDMAAQQDPLFRGEIIDGGTTIDYEIPSLEAGDYFFHCDVHPSMRGTVVVE